MIHLFFHRKLNASLVGFILLLSGNLLAQTKLTVLNQDEIRDSIEYYEQKMNEAIKESDFYSQLINRQRQVLLQDIKTLLHLFPASPYNGPILIRLAELSFEEETHQYELAVEEYDKKNSGSKTAGQDSTDKDYPKQNYEKTIALYNQILGNEEYRNLHDIALYYRAICHLRQGEEDDAIDLYRQITKKFPNSRFYIASLLKIGDYYYNRPFIDNGQGYNVAADYYRKAILNPKHSLYQEAMYKLGWCYFQQDQYSEAINIFRTLVETADLNFSSESAKQVVLNPLLRDEAVEVLAVALDENGSLEDALSFLQIIGNENYSARVLYQLSEVYQQRSDFEKAVRALQALLSNFSYSNVAPKAQLKLAENRMALGRGDQADASLVEFFDRYSKGSDWYRNNTDEAARAYVDSQAVKILIQSTEKLYRKAKEDNDRNQFITVAKNYSRLLEQYPTSSIAYEVEWNLAVIMEQNLGNLGTAFYHYMRVATAYPQEKHKQNAVLSALSVAQKEWESGTNRLEVVDTTLVGLGLDTTLTRVEENMILAVNTYRRLFPNGEKLAELLQIQGAVYYNRNRYSEAIPIYVEISKMNPKPKNFQEIYKLLGNSYMASKQFDLAEIWFQKLFEEGLDTSYVELGKKSRVEAAFRNAEELKNTKGPEESAQALIQVSKKYNSSDLADIALFTAAEIYEKNKNYVKAAETYVYLADQYMFSKYADGALFNAAGNYENATEWKKAIETYELMLVRYPNAPNIKNALFNIALNYEKLGDFEKVAQTNERYAQMFPGEKDAPDLLMSTGRFYFKAKEYNKAISIFQRYYTKYMGNELEVEARWYTGKGYLELYQLESAERELNNVVQRTKDMQGQIPTFTSFYAIEAQLGLAELAEKKYRQIPLTVSENALEKAVNEKSAAFQKVVGAYTDLIALKSIQSVVATYRLGVLYQDFGQAWAKQTRPTFDSEAKKIAYVKKILSTAGKTLDLSLPYFEKTIELGPQLSQSEEGKKWLSLVDSSRYHLTEVLWDKSLIELQAANTIVNSSVPEKIAADPLGKYLYKSKLLETALPDYKKALASLGQLWSSSSSSIPTEIRSNWQSVYAQQNYLLGARYYLLADSILSFSSANLASIPEDKREEMQFQFEDLAFELQDQALPLLTGSWELAQKENFLDLWSRQLPQYLKRLNPKKFEATEKTRLVVQGGPEWWASSQAPEGWQTNSEDSLTQNLFGPVKVTSFKKNISFSGKVPEPMWDPQESDTLYFRRILNLEQNPKSAVMDVATGGPFDLYINGSKVSVPELGPQSTIEVRSFEVQSYLKKGVNLIALRVTSRDGEKALMVNLELELTDTLSNTLPKTQETSGNTVVAQPKSSAPHFERRPLAELQANYSDRQKFLKELFKFQRREQSLNGEIVDENTKILNLRSQIQAVEQQLQTVEQKESQIKNQIESLTR